MITGSANFRRRVSEKKTFKDAVDAYNLYLEQFPDDVERFVVAPPELDQLERWVRAANDAIRKEAENKTEREVQENEKKPESPTESGLWTPN